MLERCDERVDVDACDCRRARRRRDRAEQHGNDPANANPTNPLSDGPRTARIIATSASASIAGL
jgi:hypothetical protein